MAATNGINDTITRFGHPATLIREWTHWMLLLRPAQPTLGSCVLAAKGDATDFGALPSAAHAELADVTAQAEAMLKSAVDYAKINYLMLMMVDPHVHFHVIPRYEGARMFADVEYADAGWPKLPDLAQAVTLSPDQVGALADHLKGHFRQAG